MSELVATKEYPEDYPEEAVALLEAMSLGGDLMLLGSMSLRSQQYSADYDGYEIVKVKSLPATRRVFQRMIRQLSQRKGAWLMEAKVGVKGKEKLRWTVREILENQKDGMTLEEAFASPGITKVDVIGLLGGNRFSEFSVIYELHVGGKVLGEKVEDVEGSLKESYEEYLTEGDYLKALKRQFALAKFKNDTKEIRRISPLLNSDLGRLYVLITDMRVLATVLDEKDVPMKPVRTEIDGFLARLANIYTFKDFLKAEEKLVAEVHRILGLLKERIGSALEALADELNVILQRHAKEHL